MNFVLQFVDLTIVLSSMADVLSLRDKSLLALEATSFARKFPGIHVELLSGLLQMREDVGRTEARLGKIFDNYFIFSA